MRKDSGWFAIKIANIFLGVCYLQCTIFMTLSDKKSVVVSAAIPAAISRKQGEIKSAPVLTKLPRLLSP